MYPVPSQTSYFDVFVFLFYFGIPQASTRFSPSWSWFLPELWEVERPLIWEACLTWSVLASQLLLNMVSTTDRLEINLHVFCLVFLHRTENRKRPGSSGPWQALLSQNCPPPARRDRLLPREVRVRTVGKWPSPQAWGGHRGLQAWSLPAAAALRRMRMRSSTSGRYSSAKGQVPRTLRLEPLTDTGLWLCLGPAPSSIPLGGARSP